MDTGYEPYESLKILMVMDYKMFRNHSVLQPQESEAASKQSDIGHFLSLEGKRQATKVSKGTCIQLLPPWSTRADGYEK
jgi:hypothetical protein